MPGIQLPIGIETVNPVDADYKRGPWPTIAAALAGINIALRYNNLSFYVVGDPNEYYWLDTDLTNAGLLIRSSSGGASLPIVHQVYLVEDVSDAILMGGAASNVYTTSQAAYNAADVLSAGGTIPVVIMVGKTTAAVGDIVLTANWNAMITINGLNIIDSQIGNINGNNGAGNGFNIENGNFFYNVFITSITTNATGVNGDSGNFYFGGVGFSIGTISTAITNPLNTIGTAGYIYYTPDINVGVNSTIGNSTIGSIDVTSQGGMSGSVYVIGKDITIYNINVSTALDVIGGNAIFFDCINLSIDNFSFIQGVGATTGFPFFSGATITIATINIHSGGMVFDKCNITTLNISFVDAISSSIEISNSNIGNTTLDGYVYFGNFTYNNTFGTITNLGASSTILSSTIVQIDNIGLNCSIIDSTIIGSITKATTVTVNVKGTSIQNAASISANVKLTNYNSLLPTSNYVYLVSGTTDLDRMGNKYNNVYTTFQAAYDSANALQIALGGTNKVIIKVGNTTFSATGNVLLTANWNPNVILQGISEQISNVGIINANSNLYTVVLTASNINIVGGIASTQSATLNLTQTSLGGITCNSTVSIAFQLTITAKNSTIGNIFVGHPNGTAFAGSVVNFTNCVGSVMAGITYSSSSSFVANHGNINITGCISNKFGDIGNSQGSVAAGVRTLGSLNITTCQDLTITSYSSSLSSSSAGTIGGVNIGVDCQNILFTGDVTIQGITTNVISDTQITTFYAHNTIFNGQVVINCTTGTLIAANMKGGSVQNIIIENCIFNNAAKFNFWSTTSRTTGQFTVKNSSFYNVAGGIAIIYYNRSFDSVEFSNLLIEGTTIGLTINYITTPTTPLVTANSVVVNNVISVYNIINIYNNAVSVPAFNISNSKLSSLELRFKATNHYYYIKDCIINLFTVYDDSGAGTTNFSYIENSSILINQSAVTTLYPKIEVFNSRFYGILRNAITYSFNSYNSTLDFRTTVVTDTPILNGNLYTSNLFLPTLVTNTMVNNNSYVI